MLFHVRNAVKLYVTSTNITSLSVKKKRVIRGLTTLKGQCFPKTKVSPDFQNFWIPKNTYVTWNYVRPVLISVTPFVSLPLIFSLKHLLQVSYDTINLPIKELHWFWVFTKKVNSKKLVWNSVICVNWGGYLYYHVNPNQWLS